MSKYKGIIYKASCLLLVLLGFVSCQENTLYHTFLPVNAAGWDKHDTLLYTLPLTVTQPSDRYEIGIRHKDSYKYRDLWLTVNQDTLHLYLADSIGNWKGKGIGDIRQCTFPIRLNPVPQDSVHELRVTHIMQDNPLSGIHDIGIRIRKQP